MPERFIGKCLILVVLLHAAHAVGEPVDVAEKPSAAEGDDSTTSEDVNDKRRAVNYFGLPAAPIDEPLVTDRPDFTESTLTVPRGRFQLEAGYTYTYDSGDGVRRQDHSYPEILLRVGLRDDVELRLTWAGWSHMEEVFRERNDAGRRVKVTDRDDGGDDMNIGLKIHLIDQDGWVPDFGIIVDADVPTGANGQTSGDVDPAVKLLWAYDLTNSLSLAGNVNFAAPTSDTGRFFQASASLSLAVAITERLGGYVEYFGFYPSERGQGDTQFLNGGFTYLITNNFQVDIRVGMGLNDEADDLFTGVGFSWRF